MNRKSDFDRAHPTGPGDTINMSSVYTKAASRYDFNDDMATTDAMDGGKGLVDACQSRGRAAPSDSLFVTGGGQESTMAYGLRADYAMTGMRARYCGTAKAISVVPSRASR
ncbi:hypothetical protein ACE103_09170 [Bradyrhizobium sp. ma5]|uniref:hypothetical protein n=1 Tax=Bradyrhizobium sp. ma5 TaxID=3344828 RepID=UPI0035D40D3E